jgi:hypothetical protein
MVGPGAAPADVPRKHISGRPRVAVRAHYGALPSMAGRARTRGGESHPAREVKSLRPVAGRTAPGTEIAANSAGLFACVERRGGEMGRSQGPCRAPKRGIVEAPFGAPLPSCEGEGKGIRRGPRRSDRGRRSVGLLRHTPRRGVSSNRRRWLLDRPVTRRREATPSSTAMPDDDRRKSWAV